MKTLTLFLLLNAVPVQATEPSSACGDGLRIRTQKVVAIDDQTLVAPSGRFRHFGMKPYAFGANGKFKTVRYFAKRAPAPADATAVVALFHGMNADVSQAGSMFNVMNALTRPDAYIEKGSPMDLVRQRVGRIQKIYAEAIDQPGCGNNTDLEPLTYEGIIEMYVAYLRDLRARAPGKPLIAVGYCYSAGFLIEVNRRYPRLIDGLFLTGLIVPDRKKGFDFAAARETEMYASGSLVENPAVRARADAAYVQMNWSARKYPNGSTPTRLLVGENDPFQSREALKWFENWAERSSNVTYRRVAGAGHGVLGPVEGFPESYVSVLLDLNELIRQAIWRAGE